MKRRIFLQTTGLAAGAAALGDIAIKDNAFSSPVPETTKSKRTGKIKIGLYGITYLGIWYDGPGLSFEEFVQRAKDYGYDGIELDNKRPQGNPMDIPQKRREEMRNVLAKAGIEMPAVACNNDFSSPIPEHRECQLLMVKETTRMARDLGARIVRLFPAWTGISLHEGVGSYDLVRSDYYSFQRQFPYSTILDRWNFVKDCLKESAGFGAREVAGDVNDAAVGAFEVLDDALGIGPHQFKTDGLAGRGVMETIEKVRVPRALRSCGESRSRWRIGLSNGRCRGGGRARSATGCGSDGLDFGGILARAGLEGVENSAREKREPRKGQAQEEEDRLLHLLEFMLAK